MHKAAKKLSSAPSLGEEELLARLLYRDACMLVIDKPSGMAVHPTAHDKDALDRYFDALKFGLPRPPALAHRLDRDTSGCLVLGRHRKALARLGKMFETQKVEKAYLAIVIGKPAEASGIIDLPILKSGEGSKWRITIDPTGQPALTHYKLLASNDDISLIEFSPKTGRTHQIRVHAAALGSPVMGDPFYGMKEGPHANDSMQLHAWKVSLPYYPNKPPIAVEAPVPAAMQVFIDRLGVRLASA